MGHTMRVDHYVHELILRRGGVMLLDFSDRQIVC
jgi:hypothetical protein